VLHIFGYLKGHLRSKIVFDPAYHDWSSIDWAPEGDWKEFYPGADEPIPYQMPNPRGNKVQINLICDAANATCLATQRSTTGIIMFVNGPFAGFLNARTQLNHLLLVQSLWH
jgi:hypothetical protein